jgi:hypothetical protein
MGLKVLIWFTRILAIAAILFMMMFSFDTFTGDEPLVKKLLGFLIQNIPTFVLIVFLVIAWKHELAGGLLFILAFIALAIFFKSFTVNPASLTVISPMAIAGVSFIIHSMLVSKSSEKN